MLFDDNFMQRPTYKSSKPIYEQIVENIEHSILLGIHEEGALLPSVREMSVSLGINPNTIQKSYSELMRRGIIRSSPGNGCYVSDNAKALLREEARKFLSKLKELLSELRTAGLQKEEILNTVDAVFKKEISEEEEST